MDVAETEGPTTRNYILEYIDLSTNALVALGVCLAMSELDVEYCSTKTIQHHRITTIVAKGDQSQLDELLYLVPNWYDDEVDISPIIHDCTK